MTKRIVSLLLCLLMLALMAPGAWAAGDYLAVTLAPGDTVYSLCQKYGLDYYAEKNAIMVLNGWDREYQMNTLRAGDRILLQDPGNILSYTPNVIFAEDQIEYYVIPYVIQKGDSLAHIYQLWGLRFEKYADAIRSLNGVEDLDLLFVGAIYLLPTTAENLQTDVYTTVMSHIMRQGETAYDVFTSYGIDYNRNIARLENYNGGADLTRVPVGTKLLIPLD